MEEFEDRVVVVTGGASGIGLALVRAFLRDGARVVVADVEKSALDAAGAELSGEGHTVDTIPTDVSRFESVRALADHVFGRHGACHVLCNNAGVSVPNMKLWETESSDFEWVHGVNVRGVVHGVQAFVPRMLEGGQEGFVLNTSSGDGGIAPLAEQCVYASSKAAVSILTECLAAQLEAAESKVGAGILYPAGGMLKTGIWTTKRNRPAELARESPAPGASEPTFDEFMEGMRRVGIELPVQDLDTLAAHALEGIRNGDFVIMLGREGMEQQLVDRASKLAGGQCPTKVHPGLG